MNMAVRYCVALWVYACGIAAACSADLLPELTLCISGPTNRDVITGTLTYTVYLTNCTPAALRDVNLRCTFTAPIEFVHVESSYTSRPTISETGSVILIVFPQIKSLDVATVTLTVLPMVTGPVTNLVSVSGGDLSRVVRGESVFIVRSVQVSIHDPVMAKEGDTYYLFSSGPGITFYSSKDMVRWKLAGRVFPTEPMWARSVAPLFNGHIWAPDIIQHEGKFYLYYSVSSHGQNSSAIGLAINKTLDPAAPDYKWEDQGIVLRSVPNRDLWNAIDPNIIVDEHGNGWMAFGSFWGGIKLVKLDPSWKKVAEPQEWYSIAKRDRSVLIDDRNPGPAEIEGPFIFRKGSFYYLFVSWGLCCRGTNSTYKIVVGRAKDVRGPYLDRDGKSMATGGGTLLLQGDPAWPAFGHNAVYTFDGRDYLVFHAYEAADDGLQKLKIAEIYWDDQGWPVIDKDALHTYQSVVIK